MTRVRQQLLSLGGLFAVLVAVYARALRPAPHDEARAPEDAPVAEDARASDVPPLAVPDASPSRSLQRARQEALGWGRDPFTRGARAGDVSGLTLSGILWDAEHPVAILNGEMVRVGEELEGYRVVDIAPDHIEVSDGTQTLQLSVTP